VPLTDLHCFVNTSEHLTSIKSWSIKADFGAKLYLDKIFIIFIHREPEKNVPLCFQLHFKLITLI